MLTIIWVHTVRYHVSIACNIRGTFGRIICFISQSAWDLKFQELCAGPEAAAVLPTTSRTNYDLGLVRWSGHKSSTTTSWSSISIIMSSSLLCCKQGLCKLFRCLFTHGRDWYRIIATKAWISPQRNFFHRSVLEKLPCPCQPAVTRADMGRGTTAPARIPSS
jgi:hypothetical protein